MKVTAATLLTLLAAAPSAYAANTRRLGAAADVSDIDNRRLSMDLIESAAVEPAGDDDWGWSKTKSGKSPTAKSEKSPTAKSEKSPTAKSEKSPTAKSEKSPTAKSEKSPTAKSEKSPTAKSEKSPTAKSEKSPTAKSEKSPTAKSAKGESTGMMAATAGSPSPEVLELLGKIMEVLGELGVDMPEQASGVEPALGGGGLLLEFIGAIIKELTGHGSKSGKGSKSGDHDY